MTRKKSNVKALALAVTCAILAGGYSGLNPVYAADTLYKASSGEVTTVKDTATGTTQKEIDQITVGGVTIGNFGNNTTGRIEAANVKISNNLTVSNTLKVSNTLNVGDNITISGTDGKLTAKSARIDGNNTVTGILRAGEIKGLDVTDPNNPTIVTGQAELKINGATFKDGGAITATSLELGTGADAIGDVATAIKAKASQTDLTELQTTVGADENSGLQGKIKTNASDISNLKTTVGNDSSGLVKDVNDLKSTTTGISYDGTNFTTTINQKTIINGEAQAQKLTLQETGGEAQELTAEKLKALNTAVGTDGKLTGANGSTIGGVGFNNGAVTDVKSINGKVTFEADGVYINKDADKNQIKIDNDGKVIIGKTSSAYDENGFYAGGHDYAGAKAAIKDDGSLKAADGKFTVNKDTGNVVTEGGVQVGTGSQQVLLGGGGVIATNGTDTVTLANGAVVATGAVTGSVIQDDAGAQMSGGNVTAKGSLSAADGKFKVETDGTVKVGTDKFTVDGTTGNTTVGGKLGVTGDATFGGNIKGQSLNIGATGNEFTVDINGNVVAAGKLNSKGNFSVGDNDEFTVDAATGNVVTKGGVQVGTGSQQVLLGGGGVIATNGTDKVTLANGAVVATGAVTGSVIQDGAGAQMSGGNVTAKGSLSAADGKFTVNGTSGLVTFGNDAGNQSTIAGKTATFGADTGDQTLITGGAIKAKSLTVDSFGSKTITADDELKVGTDVSLNKNGTLDLGTNTLTDAKLGNINATIKDGQVIDAKSATIGGVAFSTDGEISAVKNITAEKGTIGEVGLEDGKITANNGGTIAGVNFATSGVVTGVSDLTATGTVKAATLKVNDNNVLDSNGLKAEKAVIDNITIDGASITSNNAEGSVGIAGITVDKNGAMTGVNSIDGVKVAGGNTAGGLTIGDGATAVTIGGNSMALSSTNFGVDNDGDVTGQSFTAGNSYLKDGELKLNDANIWTTAEGIKAEKATIGANTLDSTGFSTTGTLDVAGKATFGSNAANSTTIEQGAVSVTQNGKNTTIKGGEIETDKLTVNDIVLKNSMKDGAGNTITISGHDGSLSVASGRFKVDEFGQVTNEYTTTDGEGHHVKTSFKTSQDGINADYSNTSNGNHNLLAIDRDGVALGVTDSTNQKLGGFAANKDNASLSYGANNSIVVDANAIKSALGSDVSTTLTNNGADQSIVNKVTDNATSTIKADSIVNKVGSAKRSLKADEIVDEAAGMTVKTNSDGTLFTNGTTSTLINGSKLTSTNGSATGVLDGSNLTLTDGAKNTELTAGGASFTGAAGVKGGTKTTIDGGTITTDTLNVERINLGSEMVDKNGTTFGSNLSMDAQGNFTAAGGSFKVIGGSGADKGAMTNTVGNTTLKTDTNGAGMSYDNGNVKSNVSVGNNNANVSAGAGSIDVTNESITSKVTDNAMSTIKSDSITDKVGGTTVETKDGSFSVNGKDVNGNNVGMNIDTTTGKTTFTGADYNGGDSGTTTIDGNTITTGKLITDKLVIKGNGSGDTSADGGDTGSIAFGGDGTITSNIKDGANETTFKTTADGVSSEVTNGTYTSNVDQSADRIGSVITGGNVKIGSVADASLGVLQNGAGTVNADGDTVTEASQAFSKDGSITSVAKDADGSSKLVQNGTGLEYTDSANTENATRINSSDVSIGSATDDSKRINLSDLGQIDDLDSELSARDEFTSNKTAVGGINAEAAARREEVARLDNRIDDVNNRVDKVGAMAAAIASLKSIGYDPQAPSEFSVGLGQYKGETGVALGFFHYPNKNFMINVSLSTAGGETMGGIGATWRFGHKSPQKLLDEQREAQARKELAAAEKYKAAAQLAKEAQERAEYAAKLARQAQVSADNAKAAADATQAKHFNK